MGSSGTYFISNNEFPARPKRNHSRGMEGVGDGLFNVDLVDFGGGAHCGYLTFTISFAPFYGGR